MGHFDMLMRIFEETEKRANGNDPLTRALTDEFISKNFFFEFFSLPAIHKTLQEFFKSLSKCVNRMKV